MTFGGKLQLLRKQSGLSQEQLAERLSVSRQAVSKWELDTSMPDTEKVIQISRLFQVSLDDLLLEEREHVGALHPPKTNRAETLRRLAPRIAAWTFLGVGEMAILILFLRSTMEPIYLPFGVYLESEHLTGLCIFFVLLLLLGGLILFLDWWKRKEQEDR